MAPIEDMELLGHGAEDVELLFIHYLFIIKTPSRADNIFGFW